MLSFNRDIFLHGRFDWMNSISPASDRFFLWRVVTVVQSKNRISEEMAYGVTISLVLQLYTFLIKSQPIYPLIGYTLISYAMMNSNNNSKNNNRLLRRSQNRVGGHEQEQQQQETTIDDGIGNINPNDDDDETNENIMYTMTTSISNNYNFSSYGTIIRSTTTCNESERNQDDDEENEKDIATIYQDQDQDQIEVDADADAHDYHHDDFDASFVAATCATNNHHSSRHKKSTSGTGILLRKSIISVFYAVIVILVVGIGAFLRHNNNNNSTSINNERFIANSQAEDYIVGNNVLTIKSSRVENPGGFNFDTLFGGIKKKTPASTLQSPQSSNARSILLVLHGEATPENPTVNDIDRQLTSKGMRDAEGLGIYLKEHHIPEPDWIFSSPSERTAYTTELIRRNWGSTAPVAFEQILYTLAFNDYFAFVAGLNYNYRRVMIVGHNPAILNTAKKLMRTHGIEDFPQCGFMEIR
jgi:phosphohistidine phosphatase SixA